MRWDEVEREFVILGAQLRRLSCTFEALAGALHRERANRGGSEGHEQGESKTNKDGGPQGPLPFWEE